MGEGIVGQDTDIREDSACFYHFHNKEVCRTFVSRHYIDGSVVIESKQNTSEDKYQAPYTRGIAIEAGTP
jgi:hypothetical protein